MTINVSSDMKYKLIFLKVRYPSDYKDDIEMIENLPNPNIMDYNYGEANVIQCVMNFHNIECARQYIQENIQDDVFNLYNGYGNLIQMEESHGMGKQ